MHWLVFVLLGVVSFGLLLVVHLLDSRDQRPRWQRTQSAEFDRGPRTNRRRL